jgi:ribonuclease H2 subunit C
MAQQAEEDDDDEITQEPVKTLEEQGSFDEIVVWDHEVTPDESSDAYAKGIEEWISFAEQVGTGYGVVE